MKIDRRTTGKNRRGITGLRGNRRKRKREKPESLKTEAAPLSRMLTVKNKEENGREDERKTGKSLNRDPQRKTSQPVQSHSHQSRWKCRSSAMRRWN